MNKLRLCISLHAFLLFTVLSTSSLFAESAKEPVDFSREIRPIFAKHCLACHGPDVQEAGLRLDDEKAAFAKLESDSIAIIPKHAKGSELFVRITTKNEDIIMPPEGDRLSDRDIQLIERWITEGAEWKKHWAFEPMSNPAPPKTKNSQWIKNPIDAFVLKRLESKGLSPAKQSEKRKLIRRLYFNLTGLPPTLDEVEAFVKDQSPSAYEKRVDQLLASQRYGEKWGRHWLDLVRYGDTGSYERDAIKRNAWKYRDYVIRSFNENKPYDQFIKEQIAGDEFENRSSETMIATGYYRLGPADDEPADKELAKYDSLDDIVTTTGKAFLGLTINCARCHDHKIDPIPQKDYYQFVAFFQGMTEVGRQRGDANQNDQVDISSDEVAIVHAAHRKKIDALKKKMFVIEQEGVKKMPGPDQRASEMPRRREKLLKNKLEKFLSKERFADYKRLQSQIKKLGKTKLPPREMILGIDYLKKPNETFVLMRGNPGAHGEKVEPGFPEIFDVPLPKISGRSPNKKSTGRRTVLANWIASPENMMTRRVMVNRIWQHHFGRGIVRSPNNFGYLGRPPTHPKLLDWLAQEFLRNGWNIKELHKLILMSNTYQMASVGDDVGIQIDPENNLFWHFPMRRLNAEEIRDSILAVNGTLNLKMFGPGVYPKIQQEVLQGQSRPGAGWGKSSLKEQSRRSIYIYVKRSLIVPILETFDFADTDSTCPERFTTVQPGQALAMINSPFLNQQAAFFSERLKKENLKTTSSKVRRAIELAFSRPADDLEIERGEKLIERLQKKHKLEVKTAMKFFCLTLLNQNEFLTVD